MPTSEAQGKSEHTTMAISVTVENKKALKQAALNQDVTVSTLIHKRVKRGLK